MRFHLFFHASFVPPPSKFQRSALSHGGDIGLAVAIQIRDQHLVGLDPVVLENMHRPLVQGRTGIFKPRYAPGSSQRSGHNIDVAISIEIRTHCFEGPFEMVLYHMLFPFGTVVAWVLVPGDLALQRRRRKAGSHDYVHLAIAVDIDRLTVYRTMDLSVDYVPFPGSRK